MVFTPVGYGEKEVGKHLPHTKRKYLWIFDVDGQRHELVLFCSFMSGKRVVLLDSVVLHEAKTMKLHFEFKHQIGEHQLRITQHISLFPLYVDNNDYVALLQQAYHMQVQSGLQGSKIYNSSNMTHNLLFDQFRGTNANEAPLAGIKSTDLNNLQYSPKQSTQSEMVLKQIYSHPKFDWVNKQSEHKVCEVEEEEDLLELDDNNMGESNVWFNLEIS